MAGIVSTHVAEGPQTPGFGPLAEMPSVEVTASGGAHDPLSTLQDEGWRPLGTAGWWQSTQVSTPHCHGPTIVR